MSLFNRNGGDCASQKVMLFDADPERGSALKRALLDSGFELAARLHDGARLLKEVEQSEPDALVIGIDEPDTVILQQLLMISDYCPLPVIMFAEKEAPKLIEKIVRAGVNGFVVNDIQAYRIRSIIEIATLRFQENQQLRNELKSTKDKLAERKRIDRAKGLLMSSKGLNEEQAYQAMRKMAMDRGKSLAAVADSIIDVFGALEAG